MRQSCSSTFILDCFKCICLSCFFLFFLFFFVFFCVFFHSHEKDTTLPRQKRKPATHRTPHCHVRKEPLPRTGDHTATSERNYCHIRQLEKNKIHKKKTQETPKKTKQKKTKTQKKNTKKKQKQKQNQEKHLKHLKCTWQKNSGIGECQILRVGPFFMVEEPAKSKCTMASSLDIDMS